MMIAQATGQASVFPWFTPVAWVIGIGSIIVAILGYRRSHLPLIKVRGVYGEFLQVIDSPREDRFIRIDLESCGADIFEIAVSLEVFYVEDVLKLQGQILPPGYELDVPLGREVVYASTCRTPFIPLGKDLPNPFKKGQHITMELPAGLLHELYERHPQIPKASTMSPSHVSIVITAAGNRVLKRIPLRKFKKLLARLDQ